VTSASTPDQAAVERALSAISVELGLGRGGARAPLWARERVSAVLADEARRRGLSPRALSELVVIDRPLQEALARALRVGETRFYRDPPLWEALSRLVLELAPEGGLISALSAGTSTGEEAYTLAMLIASLGRRPRVLGVDRAVDAVARGREGRYPLEAARDLPASLRRRYCSEQGGELVLGDEVRRATTLEPCDLVQRAPRGPFHLVLFRNVLLYLASPQGEAVAERLARELAPGGLLFTASSEVVRLRRAGLAAVRVEGGVVAFRGVPTPRT
jgi:chemotaxis protein methyltransferase CheR